MKKFIIALFFLFAAVASADPDINAQLAELDAKIAENQARLEAIRYLKVQKERLKRDLRHEDVEQIVQASGKAREVTQMQLLRQ